MFRSFLAAGASVLALAAIAVPAGAQAQDTGATALAIPKIEYTEWTLDNGLRVLAIQDRGTSTVTTSMWYEVGSKLDPEGRSGFSHLFEHILSRKTLNMPYNQINGLTADVGGTRNASNWIDRTNYFEIVPAEYLERMLWTHRERMAFPVVDEEVFNRERDVVKEELRQRVLAPPYGRLQRFVIPENTYDVLPHRRPGIGSIADLDSASLDDARAFHQAYYGPDTGTLIVAGNFEMDELRRLVDRYFADIPRRERPVSLAIEAREPVRTTPRSVVARAPNVPLPVRGTVWKGPLAGSADEAAMTVLAAIMAQGDNSRLDEALVRSGKAVEATFSYYGLEEGGEIATYAIINPTADGAEVDGILSSELDRIRNQPVTAAELAEAKNEIVAATLAGRQTATGRAFELGEALVSTGNPSAADDRLAAIAAVSIADVQAAARKWLDPEARVDLVYERGEENPADWANPVPMPRFATLPPPVGEPLAVRPEAEREPLPAPGARPVVEAPRLAQQVLANGIKVVSAQTSEVPIATMTVLVPGGSISDPRPKAGLANLAATLADKGTATMTGPEIAARLESLGASFSATAGSKGSYFSLTAPVANMEAAGRVLADIVTSANYPAEDFERERKRAIDGLAVSLKDPGALAQMVARPVLYGDAPFGSLPGGTQQSLASLTRDDLLAHRSRYWHPQGTSVIVSGGFSSDRATALAQNLFGAWRSASPAPVAPPNPTGSAQPVRTVVVDMPDAGQAAVYAGMRAPSRNAPDFGALEIANAVLGGGVNGRLFEEVRTKRSISYGAGSGISTDMLIASAQTQNATADEVVKVFLDEFDRLGSEALPADLVDKRRLYLGGNNTRALESSQGFNAIVANLILDGIDPAQAVRYAERLGTVSPADASKAAADYVAADRATIVVVGKASDFIDDLRAIRPDVEVIPASELDLASPDLGRGAR